MAKTVDVPVELREFNKVYEKLSYSRWSEAETFADLLDFMIACFSPFGDKQVAEYLQKKYDKDYHVFSEMMHEMLQVYHKQFGKKMYEWYDGLGFYYEVVSSRRKSSALGQFFTPPELCDLMTMITYSGEKPTGITANDPACGSGRTLLSFNAYAPGNTYYAGDIDPICAKMTAFNMCIHGMKGQVICADAFKISDDWRFGYQINRCLKFGIPSIEKIEPSACFQTHVFNQMVKECEAKMKEQNEEITREKLEQKVAERIMKQTAKTGQLSMF